MPSCLKGQAPSDPSKTSLISGPLGYQGSKAAMRVISEADVVLAVGTRSEKVFVSKPERFTLNKSLFLIYKTRYISGLDRSDRCPSMISTTGQRMPRLFRFQKQIFNRNTNRNGKGIRNRRTEREREREREGENERQGKKERRRK
jgi:thiamine pyrophosphate-dependent acetolactate synthase large subunit-like protein